MKKNEKNKEKNKFKIKNKSISLTKLNTYYDNKENYLPYKYKDASFKTQYNGHLMQKDYYIMNLMNNRLKKFSYNKSTNNNELPLIQSSPIEISKKTDIVFNSSEFEKQQLIKEYTKYAFTKLKKEFFNFNPVTSKNAMIRYRKNLFKGIPGGVEKVRYNPKLFLRNFQKQINQNNYKNWEKIKEEYEKKELNDPDRKDKFYDANKIYEVLRLSKGNTDDNNLTDRNKSIKENEGIKDTEKFNDHIPDEYKRILIFKSENKHGKKIFSPITIKGLDKAKK